MITTQELASWIPAFRVLNGEELDDLAGSLTRWSFGAGEAIIRQGDMAMECFVLVSGAARVTHQDRVDDSLRIVAMLKPGDLFGEIALIEGTVRSANVTAADPVECLIVPASTLQRLLEANHAFALGLLRMAVSRLSEMQMSSR